MYKVAKINLVGILPDGVLPSIEETKRKGIDQVSIYFRADGNLYLYDAELEEEFNLFSLGEVTTTSSKKVVYLERINSTANLLKGKPIYYIYHKADNDLYMYDSFERKEYNLFHLTPKSKGTVIVTINKVKRGMVKVTSLRIPKTIPVALGTVVIQTNKATSSNDVTITVLDSSDSSGGTVVVNTVRNISIGDATITVNQELATMGLAVIETERVPAIGDATISISDKDVGGAYAKIGTVSISTVKEASLGDCTVSVLERAIITKGTVKVITLREPAVGEVTITIGQYVPPISKGTVKITTLRNPAVGNATVTVKQP